MHLSLYNKKRISARGPSGEVRSAPHRLRRSRRPCSISVATGYLLCYRPIRQKEGGRGLPGGFSAHFWASKSGPAGGKQPEGLIKRSSEEISSDKIPPPPGKAAKTGPVRARRTGPALYSRNSAGSTGTPSRETAKWRWAPRPASLRDVLPTVPMTEPASTLSPATTAVSGWRLA